MSEQQPTEHDVDPAVQNTKTKEPAVAGQLTAGLAAGEHGVGGLTVSAEPAGPDAHSKGRSVRLNELVDEPAKVMRIGTMIRQLLEEVRNAPLDDAARSRLAEIHERSIKELEDGLAPELVQELHRINLPFTDDSVPSDAELRVAQAQLVGWLEGLFHGIQTALAAQQMANQNLAAKLQLRQLPPGTQIAPGVIVGEDGEPRRAPGAGDEASLGKDEEHHGPGQYL